VQSSEWGTERQTQRRPARTPAGSLLAALPEFAALIAPEDRKLAEQALIAPVVHARDEDLADVLASHARSAFDFLMIDGVVLKQTTLAGRSALELLGPGDVLAPPLTAVRQTESRAVSRYMAHGPAVLAVLDARFRHAVQRWPALGEVLHERLGRQTHRASTHLAMLHLPRIEDRVIALFADLAERFGRMTPNGILIDVRLTHDVIGQLVGGRRPTVTLALQHLAADGLLTRLDDRRWNLAPHAVAP
jgi:CRP/FNR family transcriptional regulator, cyclic AMP receptor protein